jgi:hypothetical protein
MLSNSQRALAAGGPMWPDSPVTEAASEAGSSSGATASGASTGLEFGARLGLGLPLGNSDGGAGDDFSKYFSNAMPIWIDAGYRYTPNWYAGFYFMYGVGSFASSLGKNAGCNNPGVGCSIHDTRVGANAHYHFAPGASFDPWVGAGLGYEWSGLTVSTANSSGGVGMSGWEFLNVQAGLDFEAARSFVFGPFVTVTLSQFDCASSAGQNGSSSSNSISSKAVHEWLTLGVRGAFDLKVL